VTESSVTECVSSDTEGKQMFRSSLSFSQMYRFLTITEELFDMVQCSIPTSSVHNCCALMTDKVQKVKKSVFISCLRREIGMKLFRTYTHTHVCVCGGVCKYMYGVFRWGFLRDVC